MALASPNLKPPTFLTYTRGNAAPLAWNFTGPAAGISLGVAAHGSSRLNRFSPSLLDGPAQASPVAAWLRDRAAASMNERWAGFCQGSVPGRSRKIFVDSHLGGRDPGRAPGEPVFELLAEIPVYDAAAAIAAVEPHWFTPTSDPRAPGFAVIGTSPADSGVRDPEGLRKRLTDLLSRGFAAAAAT